MHFETSISFATSVVWRADGDGVVVAERRVMSSDCSAMAASDLLDVDEERLELRRLRVGVAHERRQRVGEVAHPCHALEAPVDRDADRVHFGAVAVEGLDALRDAHHALDLATVGSYLHPVAVPVALIPLHVL